MKNTTKAVLAGGVGAVLLLGGAGTIAFWTDNATGGTGVIQSGTLTVDDPTTQTWTIQHRTTAGGLTAPVTFAPATDQIVPGDVLSFTQSAPVRLEGEAIAATFAANLDITYPEGDTAAAALDAALGDPQVTLDGVTGGALTRSGNTITGEGTGNAQVSTTITFPWGSANDYNAAKLADLNFAVNYTLTQVPEPVAP